MTSSMFRYEVHQRFKKIFWMSNRPTFCWVTCFSLWGSLLKSRLVAEDDLLYLKHAAHIFAENCSVIDYNELI